MQINVNKFKEYARALIINIGYVFNYSLLYSIRPLLNLITPERCMSIKNKLNQDIFVALAIIEDLKSQILKFNDLPEIVEIRNGVTIQIFQEMFFDLNGEEYLDSEKEQYLIDLCNIIEELGYIPFIIQHGKSFWHKNFKGINIFGVPTNSKTELLNILGHDKIFGQPRLRIYSDFMLAYPNVEFHSIGISHGMFWNNSDKTKENLPLIHTTYHNLKSIVSVDKATISWLHALMPEEIKENNKRILYLSNYIHTNEIILRAKSLEEKIIILYPRKLCKAYGFNLLAEIIPYLIGKYSNIEFHFVGKIESESLAGIKNLLENYPKQVFHYLKNSNEMSEIYQKADITIFPTTINEGTLRSCLEAMKFGNAIIASNVGGIMDLIINNFNGLLITPTEIVLRRAILKLINDPQLRHRLSTNSQEVIKTQDFNEWKLQWKNLILENLDNKHQIVEKNIS